mmetsp:Transcript_69399/g.137209  ORF Transcript_69399/g.137209 Transcript_69399/m.137209 type:complete len:717 (-) Transcript_69399:122-2272(-)
MGCTPSADKVHAGSSTRVAPSAAAHAGPREPVGTCQVQIPVGAREGQTLQVQAPTGVRLQFQIPQGVSGGSIIAVQYPLSSESEAAAASRHTGVVEANFLPKYWTNVVYANLAAFDELCYVAQEHENHFQELLNGTYKAKATQDRPCPHGSCPKRPGGCKCVQPDGDPGLPTGYRVRRVVRVEDSEMWGRYISRRKKVKQLRSNQAACVFADAVQTNELANKYPNTFEPLASDLNEVYLWHGTSVRVALSIAQEDFRLDTAGRNVGTMYGRGIYLAENSTKADEYAKDDPGGFYDGVFAMLLCRVCLGKFFYTTERNEDAIKSYESGEFDSTCGDRAKSVGTFREFVVYDSDQLYPEYVILYQRCHKGDETAAPTEDAIEVKPDQIAALPFQLQLPVYWGNAHLNPEIVDFHGKYETTAGAKAVLQRLVEASCPRSSLKVVDAAWRIENAGKWCNYNRAKSWLRDKLEAGKINRFRPVDALDGSHRGSGTRLANWVPGEPITTSNVDDELNEALLWHVTTAEVAEGQAHELHRVAEVLGTGFYFVNGLKGTEAYVLLCRVLCGDVFQNRILEDNEAVDKAEACGSNAVLVAGSPTTVVVWDPDQIYPEFVVKLTNKSVKKTRHEQQQPQQQQPASQQQQQQQQQQQLQPPLQQQQSKTSQHSCTSATSSKSRTMLVQIPPGARPGAAIQAATPDGYKVQAVIPAGMQPGQQLRVAY